MRTEAAILWEPGERLERRGDRARPAQGAARSSSRWSRRACATPTTTSAPATSRPSRRSSAATRAPASSWRSATGSRGSQPGRPRRLSLHPRLRPLPVLRRRALEPVRQRCRPRWPAPARDGTTRHHARGQDICTMACLGTFAAPHRRQRGRASRSRTTSPSSWPACSAAASSPAGARPSTRPGPGRPTTSPSSASAASAPAPCRARASPAPSSIIAVDPVESKRERALALRRHPHGGVASSEAVGLLKEITWGRMANQLICAWASATASCSSTRCPASGSAAGRRHQHPPGQRDLGVDSLPRPHPAGEAARGSIFGSANPRSDIPKLLDLHAAGQLPSTSWSPRPTRSTGSTTGTRTCATAPTSGACCCPAAAPEGTDRLGQPAAPAGRAAFFRAVAFSAGPLRAADAAVVGVAAVRFVGDAFFGAAFRGAAFFGLGRAAAPPGIATRVARSST